MIIKSEKQLLDFVKYSPIIVIAVVAILVNVLIYIQHKSNYEKDLEVYKKNYIETNEALVKAQVEKVYANIISEQKEHKDNLQITLEKRLNEAYSIIENLHKKYSNKSNDEILKLVSEALRNIRFNDERGYFYLISMDGVNLMHPIKPSLENKSLFYNKNHKGEYLVQDIINNLKEKDTYSTIGYYYKPGIGNKRFEKILSHKIYRPLNLFIGTGEYIDDYLDGLKKYILEEHIQHATFGKNGYVFVFDYDGVQLAHIKKSYIGQNRIDLTDANGFKITQGIIEAAKNKTGFVKYIGTILPETGQPASKTTYVKGMDKWGWAIGAGFYDKELYDYLGMKKVELEELNKESMKTTIFISLALSILLVILALYITNVLDKFFKNYKNRIAKETDENRRKDLILYQQSKMASMGEMLGNIAHQWRQPLSTISTIASGNKLQKEINVLSDEDFDKSMDTIVTTTKYLSQTIDDFRDFFNPNKIETSHTTSDIYEKSTQLISSRLSNEDIIVVKNIDNVEIITYENELVQSLINILNNSIDAFENKKVDEKVLFFDIKYTKECKMPNCQITDCHSAHTGFVNITIKDNAGGIPTKVIDKVFDVYFTTKHKSQGTGIGLYMTYEIITKHLEGSITVENDKFTYKNKEYTGAKFTIILPLK